MPVWSWTNTGASTIGNTRLGIEADWQTYLGMYQPLRGTYGFRIIIKGVTASTEASAQTEITKEEYFTNYDMYGNTYAYYTPYTQQKVIDISDFVNVHSINIYFYQDFNFADASNQTIYYNEVDGTAAIIDFKLVPIIPENISFDNVNIYLGVSAEDIKDESTFLYSYGALGYTGIETKNYDDATGTWVESTTYSCNTEHDLHFVWVHYEANGTYSVIDEFDDLVNQRGEDGLKTTHVFWYRYLYDEDITEEELTWSENHEELRKDWEDSMNNESYETKMERYGGANWTFLPAWTDTFENKFIPRGNKSREKFKVVIQHDGTHTTSKELIFTNTRDIEAEIASGAKNDAVVLKCFKLKKVRDVKNDWTGKYEAIEDGSINAFHVYDENNKILYNDDDERYDQHAYYIQIQVRNEDTNKYEMLTTIAENGTETNTQVAWAFPRAYSMIASTQEVDIYDAAYFGIDATNEPIRYQNFHNSTIKFTIQSVYNNRYLDNTVGAIIKRNEKDHHIERELMFGRTEGQGHEFLPIIEIIYPVGGTYLRTDNEFQIACAVYNKDGSLFESPSLLTFNWKELGQQSEFYHYDKNGEPAEGYQITSYPAVDTSDENYEQYIDSTYVTKYKGYRGNVVRGWLKGNNAKPPIFEVTVNGAASYPLIVRKGFLVCNNHDYKQSCDIMVPSRVEFKSDGANPIFYNDVFEVAHLTSNVNSSTATYDIEYPVWNINNEDIFHLESSIKERTTIERLADNTVGVNDRSYTQYKLAFNTTGSPQWTDTYLKPDNYTYIYYTTGENNATYVAQSIAFDRNYYSSSLVNDWDGTSLTWDEENGAILSTMIAAGSKDTNNKFTGVMMGDWHAKGDESLDVPGLYGYNKGGQTFGFKTDGTGFIGASGKGRIEFDGTEALISNADRSCYINLNPIVFNLTEEDSRNQSFSQNFLYCKVPKTTNVFNTVSDAILGEESWARPYFQDNVNDYFVVDPNHGVLTTGGIVARYGAIGNWMISHEGLYQKSDEHKKYMYLGYDVYGEEAYQESLMNAAAEYENVRQTALNNKTTLINQAYNEYQDNLVYYNENKNSTDSEIIKQLYLYDLDHYMNIGHGLAITAAFLEKCINFTLADPSEPNRLENYFNGEYTNYYNSYADKGWHYHYDENGVQSSRQYQTGWAITLRQICLLGDPDRDNTLIEATYYGTQVIVPRIAGIYTIERFQQIIDACYAGYQIFENDENRQIAEAWGDYPDRIRSIYDYQVSLAENQYQSDLTAAENNYNEILQTLNNTKTGTGNDRYCIYAGESDPAKVPVVQPGSPAATDPYFYVKWDGTFFARRGLIANTWTVDDTSLVYEVPTKDLTNGKIYDKIYIGKGEANSAIINPTIEAKIYPIEATRPAANRWAISAGQRTDYTTSAEAAGTGVDSDYINFGVTLSGELYSQLGTVGGWKINENQLYAVSGNMIFDSENSRILIGDPISVTNGVAYPIMIDGATGLMSIAGTGHEDVTTGYLYLGNLSLEAISVDSEWQVPYTITQSNGQYYKISLEDASTDYDNSNSWDGGGPGSIEASVAPLEYYKQITTTDTKKLTSSNTFNIITRDNSGNYGVAIASGITDNGEKITAIYPTGCALNNSSLGISGYRWNIYANILDAVSINTSGVISAKNMFMNNDKVATEPWVYNLLADVWASLNDLSNAASSNAGSLKRLGNAMANNVITNCSGAVTGDGEYTITYKNKNGGTVLTVPMTDISHGHTLSIDGTTLNMETRARHSHKGVSLSHHHEVSGSMSGDGTLTVTVGDANFNQATGTYTIDCSAWLKEKVRSIWLNNVYVTCDAHDGSGGGSAEAKAELKWSSLTLSKYDTDSWDCTASHGANIEDTGETVKLNGYYTRYIIEGKAYYR